MLAKRIIPCLDVKNGRVVKGINFVNLTDAGDPVECAAAYDKAGADELTFLDITASSDARASCSILSVPWLKRSISPLRSAEASAALRIIPICCTQVRRR